jgi:hypothetical protein
MGDQHPAELGADVRRCRSCIPTQSHSRKTACGRMADTPMRKDRFIGCDRKGSLPEPACPLWHGNPYGMAIHAALHFPSRSRRARRLGRGKSNTGPLAITRGFERSCPRGGCFVPREYSTGGKQKLLGISINKRGRVSTKIVCPGSAHRDAVLQQTGIRTALLVRSTYGSYPPECGDCSADEHVGPDGVGGFMQKRDAAYSCSGHGDLNLLAHR